jgi:hypothetical protein
MDSIFNAAALALSRGDLLGALNRVALRDDPPALALRGIAMAQLGELGRARQLLREAARGFGNGESVARARCVLAEAEIALVSRDLTWPSEHLDRARELLASRGDAANAAHAGIIGARRHLLLGNPELALQHLAVPDRAALPPALLATFNLVLAGIEVRRFRSAAAREALKQADAAAVRSGIAGLIAEVAAARQSLEAPVALLRQKGRKGAVSLDEVETLLLSDTLVVDATRNALRQGGNSVSLSTRPVLFALARALAEAWPTGASREVLLAGVFNARHADESHRTRLRVEIARLRKIIQPLAEILATSSGFRLTPRKGDVAVLAVPFDGQNAIIMALLADGELWSSSALSLVLGASTRTVQRALESLQQSGKIQTIGRGRARRWMSLAFPGFPSTLLLPGGQ